MLNNKVAYIVDTVLIVIIRFIVCLPRQQPTFQLKKNNMELQIALLKKPILKSHPSREMLDRFLGLATQGLTPSAPPPPHPPILEQFLFGKNTGQTDPKSSQKSDKVRTVPRRGEGGIVTYRTIHS
jgi:hypothetical protein